MKAEMKRLDLTKKEQSVFAECMKNIAGILSKKMDKGVAQPSIYGELIIDNEGRVLDFSFELKKT